MTRTSLTIVATAALLVLVPAAAHAAPSAEASERTSVLLAAPGAQGNAVVYAVNGPVENEFITVNVVSTASVVPESAISIAGAASLKKPTADGSASFEVTMTEGGTYTLVATAADGALLDSQVVTVGAEGAATVVAAERTGQIEAASAVSAASPAGVALGAAALAVAGAGAVVVAMRRRELSNR